MEHGQAVEHELLHHLLLVRVEHQQLAEHPLLGVDPGLTDGAALSDLVGEDRSQLLGERDPVGVAVPEPGVAGERVGALSGDDLGPVGCGRADLDVAQAVARVTAHAVDHRPVDRGRQFAAVEEVPRGDRRVEVAFRRKGVVLVEVSVNADHVVACPERICEVGVGPGLSQQRVGRVAATRQRVGVRLRAVLEELVARLERVLLGVGIEPTPVVHEVGDVPGDLLGSLDEAADRALRHEQLVIADSDACGRAVRVVAAVHPGIERGDALVVPDELLGERSLVRKIGVVDDVRHRDLAVVADDHDVLDRRGVVPIDHTADRTHHVVRSLRVARVREPGAVCGPDGFVAVDGEDGTDDTEITATRQRRQGGHHRGGPDGAVFAIKHLLVDEEQGVDTDR